MNIAAIRAALQLILLAEQYGPVLIQIGIDVRDAVAKAHEMLSSSGGHPSLTDAERAEFERIVSTDPSLIGMNASPIPDPQNPRG